MSKKIRIGIAGYGNLGRGVESAVAQNADMELVGVFSRRPPASVSLLDASVPVYPWDDIENFRDAIDVLILCGGSRTDLPEQGPALARAFTTVDSFDTHARIPEYYAAVDAAAQAGGNVALISVGWDPGLFSLNRLFGEAILPEGATYTFWGKGLSQGHSDAVRRVPGVKGGVQYTVPVPQAVQRVRDGEQPVLSTREKHKRECFVVLAEGADQAQVRDAIVTMPDYFADYDTTVTFISEETLRREHNAMPHGGFVIRSGTTGTGNKQIMEYALALDSNPEFTSSVLVAYARAAYRLKQAGERGARSVFDVAPGLLSPKSAAELRKELL
ncbi:diaminopimelate dehydrogenase [Pseudomonas sp. S 311-6]|jgi:diaminopimelate dehydrogenase|uniref:Meso-diaminopimelate D-dehydrogenase n=1 Tax=Kerstersia gyiorum TaxID=206506 RepID=A0A171KS53_9BURK|nr:diaminopimelate dehydrogenase [Kerstersia gyiorum]AZV94106.1 diaminopimelate dehydrogenase [Bordetella sp. J329]MCO7637728.1 diaminopimelate dehydrogenase [Pseudomonas sp. S 311-6]KAB0541620.1 diaminopimelate dehydrogenase [Kerstersia gyiorum]KKO71720.1 cytochrome C2 [Kerstersia gyiorum]MCH4273292.1 diaminopimelate dehydrogenase [Kerstersia gyiorum]